MTVKKEKTQQLQQHDGNALELKESMNALTNP
jgi:hypothetical protein